jgi:hypothetical protein
LCESHAAPVFPNEPVEDCAPLGQPLERADLVSAHEAAVAFHIRCEDCDEASADCHRVCHACLIPKPSPFRHPGHPQALIDALASREIYGMVAWGVSAVAADTETRIERKARLRCSPRLIQFTDVRQDRRQIEMRNGVISVGFKAPAQPNNRFGLWVLS